MAYGLSDIVQQRRMIENPQAEAFKRVSIRKLDALVGLPKHQLRAPAARIFRRDPPAQMRQLRQLLYRLLATQSHRAEAVVCAYRTGQRFGAMH